MFFDHRTSNLSGNQGHDPSERPKSRQTRAERKEPHQNEREPLQNEREPEKIEGEPLQNERDLEKVEKGDGGADGEL